MMEKYYVRDWLKTSIVLRWFLKIDTFPLDILDKIQQGGVASKQIAPDI